MFSMFLLSYRNTRESLGELEKAEETLACKETVASPLVPTAFLVLPNFHSCFYNSIETQYKFSISKTILRNFSKIFRNFRSISIKFSTFFHNIIIWIYTHGTN